MKRFATCTLTICVMTLILHAAALAQNQDPFVPTEGIPMESDFVYERHYNQVQEIMKLPLGQRETGLEDFNSKLDPKAKIHAHMSSFLGQVVLEYRSKGNNAAADKLQARIYELYPHLKPSPAQLMQAAFQAKDHAKAIELAERIYRDSRDKQAAYVLAQSYIATGNGPKAAEYSQKVIDTMGAKDGIYFVAWLADYYSSQRDTVRALPYYEQMLKAYPTTVPQGWDANRWSQTLGKGILLKAVSQYTAKDYKSAISTYYKSLEFVPRNEQAYFFIGLSHWKMQELNEAMGAFALASVLDKPGSAKARQYLEQLYKARNKDSLEGLDQMLDEARSRLN